MASLSPTPVLSSIETSRIRRWTVTEYRQISEMGLLNTDGRTELLAGQILLMASKGTSHVTALRLLASVLDEQLPQDALVCTQDPIELTPYSEPEPDLVIVRGQILDYLDHHPQPTDVYLVVEVADSTLRLDCDVKSQLYAQAGLQEYWVVDISNHQLHCFREPTADGYRSHSITKGPEALSPQAFPSVVVDVRALFPSAS